MASDPTFGGRTEDRHTVTGRGRYVADFVGPDTLFAGFVRSGVASAGVDDFDLPATPARVWQALQRA